MHDAASDLTGLAIIALAALACGPGSWRPWGMAIEMYEQEDGSLTEMVAVPSIENMWRMVQEVSDDGIGLKRSELVESSYNREDRTSTATHTLGLTDAELAFGWIVNAHAFPQDSPEDVARVLVFG